MKLIIATKNEGKVKEIKEVLKDTDFEILSMSDLNIDIDVVEDKDTFEGNAIKKAQEIMKATGELTLADDSGLVVAALGGVPGILSARFSGENATDESNNIKLLKALNKSKRRDAKFVCVMALAYPDGRIKTAQGEIEGQIGLEIKGSGGFGYDALFYLPEHKMTSAEIPASLKNEISHRAKALKLIKTALKEV